MFLETTIWQEIDLLDRDGTIALCCISATEQHSLHLPMGTDYFIGSEIVHRLEMTLPSQLLCLPTIWFAPAVTTRTLQEELDEEWPACRS